MSYYDDLYYGNGGAGDPISYIGPDGCRYPSYKYYLEYKEKIYRAEKNMPIYQPFVKEVKEDIKQNKILLLI